MDLIADRGRRVTVEELNTTQLLAHAAKQARDHQGRQAVGETEHHVGERQAGAGDDEDRLASESVAHAAPDRAGDELRGRIQTQHNRDQVRAGTHTLHVKRQQGDQQAESHQVDENDQKQNRHTAQRPGARDPASRPCVAERPGKVLPTAQRFKRICASPPKFRPHTGRRCFCDVARLASAPGLGRYLRAAIP